MTQLGTTMVMAMSKWQELSLTNSPRFGVKCKQDTPEWFKECLSRTEERSGMDMTHEEFLRLLLEIYELHEQDAKTGKKVEA